MKPITIESSKYYLSFLKALYHSCEQKFDLPNIAIEGWLLLLLDIQFSKICMIYYLLLSSENMSGH